MGNKHLVSVEKWTLAFAAVAIAASLVTVGGRVAFGVTMGALVMSLNAWAMRRIGQRAGATKPGATVLLFNLKMMLLLGVIFLVIHFLPVDPVGFILGISIFPLAIVATAIRHQLRADSHDNQGETHG